MVLEFATTANTALESILQASSVPPREVSIQGDRGCCRDVEFLFVPAE